MIEPLPNARSICESAASRAFDLSIGFPSTTRKAALIFRSLWPVFAGPTTRAILAPQPGMKQQCTPFVLRSQYVLFASWVLACFDPWWPVLKMAVAYFGGGRFRVG